jgi:hypothetical protein
LDLRGQIEVTLERAALRVVQVIETVAHQGIGQQTILLYGFVAFLAQAEVSCGHPFQRRIHFPQKTSKTSLLGCECNRCFQSALTVFQLIVQERYFYGGHDCLLAIKRLSHSILLALFLIRWSELIRRESEGLVGVPVIRGRQMSLCFQTTGVKRAGRTTDPLDLLIGLSDNGGDSASFPVAAEKFLSTELKEHAKTPYILHMRNSPCAYWYCGKSSAAFSALRQ